MDQQISRGRCFQPWGQGGPWGKKIVGGCLFFLEEHLGTLVEENKRTTVPELASKVSVGKSAVSGCLWSERWKNWKDGLNDLMKFAFHFFAGTKTNFILSRIVTGDEKWIVYNSRRSRQVVRQSRKTRTFSEAICSLFGGLRLGLFSKPF